MYTTNTTNPPKIRTVITDPINNRFVIFQVSGYIINIVIKNINTNSANIRYFI